MAKAMMPPAMAVDGGKRPRLRARDSRSWTKAKERRFLEALAESCNVKHAAKEAGVAPSGLYVRRARDASFRAGWDRALATGYAQLELMMLERALHGVEKIVVAKDGSREVMREYSDRVGLALLRMHRDGAGIADEEHGPEEVAEAAERILSRLKKIGGRDGPSTAAGAAVPLPREAGGGDIEVKSAPSRRLGLIAWGLGEARR